MENSQHSFLLFIVVVLIVVIAGLLAYYLKMRRGQQQLSMLLKVNRTTGALGTAAQERGKISQDITGAELERVKQATKSGRKGKKVELTQEQKFFQAGMYTRKEQQDFKALCIILPIIISCCLIALCLVVISTAIILVLCAAIIGALIGLYIPIKVLESRIASRQEDILFFLPLVIEQVSIGVSSSLDIGPCVQRIVQMADERDTHNVVTELLRHVEYFVKSGVSFEEALLEVGINSGSTELKHTFMSLAQVAKHGGEVSKQLQELADSVSSQREAKIEGVIKRLELKATGPVALVFFGYMLVLFTGFVIQVKNAFSGSSPLHNVSTAVPK